MEDGTECILRKFADDTKSSEVAVTLDMGGLGFIMTLINWRNGLHLGENNCVHKYKQLARLQQCIKGHGIYSGPQAEYEVMVFFGAKTPIVYWAVLIGVLLSCQGK